MRTALVVCSMLLLGGCVDNPFRNFYQEFPGAGEALARREAPAPKTPRVDLVRTVMPEDVAAIQRTGYAIIGFSSFKAGGNIYEQSAVTQAIAVGADRLIIVSPRYTATRTTESPYTSGSTTADVPRGPVTVYGSLTTTSYGSRTTAIPLSSRRNDHAAFYLVKQKFVLGAYFVPLSDEERARLGTNKGVKIGLVVDNSPAFESDLVPGDILLAMNGKAIANPEIFHNGLDEFAGNDVEFTVTRGDKVFSKRVQLNPM